jgi:hypothetical protein
MRWQATLAALVLILAAACADTESQSPATTPAEPAEAVLTNREWPLAHADPTLAVGRRVELRSRVYSVSKVANDLVLCAWVDFDNDQLATIFRIPGASEGVERDDFIWVEGVVSPAAAEVAGCGGAREPEVEVTHLTVTDRVGVRPALRSLPIDQALERRGIRITLDRIEFAAEETRIYFTLENSRDETLLAFATELVIEVEGIELAAIIPIGQGIPAPRGRVASGGVEHGGFLFSPLEQGGPPITVRWRGVRLAPSGDEMGDWTWVVDLTGSLAPEG